MGCIPCEMRAYERHAYERGTPTRWSIGDARLRGARLWEMPAYERHVYEMAYRRCTPMRETRSKTSIVGHKIFFPSISSYGRQLLSWLSHDSLLLPISIY
jgi:hypothetical protein